MLTSENRSCAFCILLMLPDVSRCQGIVECSTSATSQEFQDATRGGSGHGWEDVVALARQSPILQYYNNDNTVLRYVSIIWFFMRGVFPFLIQWNPGGQPARKWRGARNQVPKASGAWFGGWFNIHEHTNRNERSCQWQTLCTCARFGLILPIATALRCCSHQWYRWYRYDILYWLCVCAFDVCVLYARLHAYSTFEIFWVHFFGSYFHIRNIYQYLRLSGNWQPILANLLLLVRVQGWADVESDDEEEHFPSFSGEKGLMTQMLGQVVEINSPMQPVEAVGGYEMT